jgi:outer membrane protein assembly factor BamE (lipoprotein component of BamABCDE complex)
MPLRNESSQTVAARIVEGKTTKQEVQDAYGQPSSTSFTDSGNEIWTYRYAYATPKAINFVPLVGIFRSSADVQNKELVILFDKNNVVTKYSFRESAQEVTRGLAPK